MDEDEFEERIKKERFRMLEHRRTASTTSQAMGALLFSARFADIKGEKMELNWF